MAIIKLVIAFLLTFTQFLSPYFAMVSNGGIDNLYEVWSAEDEYTEDYAITMEKDPDKDFVVLNFADIQLSANEVYGEPGAVAEATIKKCIEDVQPDLITLTGDNAWCKSAYIRMAKVIDSYGIPWAPVMGNHDGDNGKKTAENWCALTMTDTENCIFRFGPLGMGVGNYVINITENGEIIHSIYMMDTHTDTDRDCGGYDHLWDNQLAWYKWAVEGNNAIAGKTVESSIFFHIPCIQYREACNFNEETRLFEVPDDGDSFGSNHEWVCSPEYDSGFFALVKELGSTKNMIAGHDHVNDSSIEFEGVRLSYSLKCGSGCYWEEGKNGGSTLTIGSDGHATFAHHYVALSDIEYGKTVPLF